LFSPLSTLLHVLSEERAIRSTRHAISCWSTRRAWSWTRQASRKKSWRQEAWWHKLGSRRVQTLTIGLTSAEPFMWCQGHH